MKRTNGLFRGASRGQVRFKAATSCSLLIAPNQRATVPPRRPWERWPSADGGTVRTCVIITMAANALLRRASEQAPAIVPPTGFAA